MPSDVERQAVFQATKVRTNLKKDGSWISKSQDVQDTQPDIKARKPVKLVKPKNETLPESSSVSSSSMPCAESAVATFSNLDSSTPPQSSYVVSALRKFEPLSSKENTPVRSGSNQAESVKPVLQDSINVAKTSIVKPAEQPPADVRLKDEKPIVISAEEPLKIHADAPKTDIVKKPVEKPVEEQLKTHADAPKTDVVKKPIVTSVEEPLKTHADAPKTDVVKKPIEKPVEEPLKTHADAPKTDVVKKPIEKPVEEPLKTHAYAPKTDVVKKPIVKYVEKPKEEPVEEPLKYSPVKSTVEKPAEKSLKTHTEAPIEETEKTPVKTVKTHENATKPSGTLTTENKEDHTVEQVTVAHAPVVEAPLAPRQVQNQPTSKHGELSLVSALETPTTESSTRASTEPTEEHHRLNSKADLKMKGKTLCSFCKLPVDGNVKITINIPAICCHQDCFKCNDCSSPLGDLSSSMYHYAGKILCGKCFDQIFQL
ncbi:hypothetical protein QQF64_026831 [Cirrhinus molitorella]|uniref:LIM zinc-binding domain-containing protein n=1 Tax=Cirrhinus molitorella TaxID=172907 RepID=A0ABR3NBB0_9TELE